MQGMQKEQIYLKNKMTNDLKDTATVLLANGSALGITLTQANDALQFISLVLAIGYTIYKMINNKVK